jgi:hypothetical protein
MTPPNLDEKRLDISIQIRNFEIDLFWKRALFFWGFIASAFVGYAALRGSDLRIVVACFGMVCSAAWTLSNRGSKYWQESWETKVERYEVPAIGELFAKEESEQFDKGCWLRGRKYSVSKLTIALSDYVFLLWLTLVVGELARITLELQFSSNLRTTFIIGFIALSFIYLLLFLVLCKKTPRRKGMQ